MTPVGRGVFGRGVLLPHRGSRRPCLRRLRATERAHRGGVPLVRSLANSEGPHCGASLLGRSRRSFGSQRVGTRKARKAAHPRGNRKTARSARLRGDCFVVPLAAGLLAMTTILGFLRLLNL